MNNKTQAILIGSLLGSVALFSFVGFIFWTVVPQMQGREYLKKAKIAYTPEVIINDKFIFEPYTNAQGLIRYTLLADLIRKFGENPMPRTDPLFEKAADELETYVTRFPYYYDYFLLLGKAYEARAIMKSDESLLKTAEKYYNKALEVAPGRQDALYAQTINLISQGRSSEALAILKAVTERYPNLADNHYEVGQALVILGKDRYDEALLEFEMALNKTVNLNPPLTLQIYQKFLYYYYHKGDVARLNTVAKRLAVLDFSQSQAFLNLSAYIEKNHTMPLIDIKEE